ncbi:MAG: PAS domain S-box protein, partial [Myxococcota bacterium]|nr:PAS domain S-box protein [Myxococcota bacterium]
ANVKQLLNGFRIGEYKSTLDLCVLTANGHQKTLSISTASLDPNIKKEKVIHEKTSQEYQSQEVAAIISMRDVTETRVIETELKRTKEFLENVIDSSVDAIIATDMTGTVLIYNDGAERILGYLPEEIVEKLNVKDLYVDDAASTIMRAFWSEEHGGMGKYDGGRHEILAKDGQRVPISISAALIFHQNEPIASVGIFRDLRERIRMENELTTAQQKLQMSERQKAVMELAGAAAHELSQPLTTIMGSAELLRLKLPFDEKYDKLLSRIVVQSERMAELLAKIGQITRYETKPYLEKTNIIDLDASSEKRDEK